MSVGAVGFERAGAGEEGAADGAVGGQAVLVGALEEGREGEGVGGGGVGEEVGCEGGGRQAAGVEGGCCHDGGCVGGVHWVSKLSELGRGGCGLVEGLEWQVLVVEIFAVEWLVEMARDGSMQLAGWLWCCVMVGVWVGGMMEMLVAVLGSLVDGFLQVEPQIASAKKDRRRQDPRCTPR